MEIFFGAKDWISGMTQQETVRKETIRLWRDLLRNQYGDRIAIGFASIT